MVQTDRQATDGNIIQYMRCACCINKARMHTYTITFSTYRYSTAATVMRTLLNVTSHSKSWYFNVCFHYFAIQVTVTRLRSGPAVTVVCSSEVLRF